MEQLSIKINECSKSRVIASSPLGLRIELMEYVGNEDIPALINVSESLVEEYGATARLTKTTIRKYFNYPKTHPFVARFNNEIVGYIIGVPLEHFTRDVWAKYDQYLGQKNTLYTYAFVILAKYRKNGFAKTLKRVYLNWSKKHGFKYITGHVVEGIAKKFSHTTVVVKRFRNWHGSGKTFEYYRRPIHDASVGKDF